MPQTCSGSVISPCRVRSPRGLIALLVGLALSVGMNLGAQAATTWTVCASGCDYSRIKAAIAAPTTLEGDTLAIAAGTYTEPGILVAKSVTLQGEAAATTIVQAAASRSAATDRVFTIASGVTVTLQDLTIRYGHTDGDGGGVHNAGTLLLTDSIVRSNEAWGGGGLSNYHGMLTLTRSTIRGNLAGSSGGGLFNDYGLLTLTQSIVSGNTARDSGGGLFNYDTLTLTQSTVSGNTAGSGGGGLVNAWGRLTLTSSIVASNPDGGDCDLHSGSVNSHGYNVDSDGSCQLTAPTDQPIWRGPLAPCKITAARPSPTPCSPAAPRSMPFPGAPRAAARPTSATSAGRPGPKPSEALAISGLMKLRWPGNR